MFSAFQTFGKLGALASSVARAWSPLALWPDGISSAGMWISPRDLTSQWADDSGTTPVATPGTVADSSNPVGLALDIRAGTPALGPELVTNGDFSAGLTDWTPTGTNFSASGGGAVADGITSGGIYQIVYIEPGKTYFCEFDITGNGSGGLRVGSGETSQIVWLNQPGHKTAYITADAGAFLFIQGEADAGPFSIDNISVKEVLDLLHLLMSLYMLQYDSATRPLLSAYDGQTLGPGDTYDSAGYPIAQLYDGVNDSMATAAFSAGTLIDGMDCLIAVRRDSAKSCVAGLYNGNPDQTVDATKFFGMAESASGSGCVGSGAGTPTVWVDNTQLTGGTAVTRGTLHTALTVGDWHILEFRNLDLSTWTAAGFGLYTSYTLTGARGDIMLYPSTASTEDKDAARQWLADYYGVTLS